MQIHCKYDELVNITQLKPHIKNRNKHPKDQIDRLAKILAYQGIRAPLVVSKRSGMIVKGHGTLMAIKLNKEKQAPVVYQDFDSEDQEYAFVQSDNSIASWAELDLSRINTDLADLDPSFDIDLLGIKDFTLDAFEKEGQCDEDDVPEKVEPKTKLGDLYLLGEHRLLCGDSTDINSVEKLMNGQKADMVFTDPPYGIGFEYNEHKDIKGEQYESFCSSWFENIKNLADFKVIFTGWSYNYFWYSKKPKDTFYWLNRNKRTGGSISNFRRVEPIFIWGRPHKKYDFDFFDVTTKIDPDLHKVHTCPKQVDLIELVLDGCITGGTVIDVFGGSGTTLIACEKTNRKCFMMELDPHYCSVIIERWKKYTGKEAYRVESNGDKTPWSEIKI